MTCRTRAVVIIALIAAAAARSGGALPLRREGQFRTNLDSIRSLPPNLVYYTMMKDPQLRGMVKPERDSEGLRMVGSWNRGPSWHVTGNDTLVYLNLGSECAIVNFADPAHPQVLAEIPAADVSFRSILKDSLLFIGGCGIDIWNVKHPTTPQFISRVNLTVSDIAVQDSFLYAVNADSFRVFSFANPAAPVQVGASGDTGFLMTAAPGRAYVSTRWTMAVIDVSDPRHPNWVGTYPARTGCLFARDTLVYATVWDNGFQILNVSDPGNIRMIGSLPSLEIRGDIDIRDFFAYVPNFAVIDVGDPTNPTIISQCPTPGEQGAVWVRDPWSYAYVADVENGLQVVDIHDPVHPALDTTILQGGESQDIAVKPPLAVVATPDAGLRILNVGNPVSPCEVGAYDTTGYWNFYAVALDDSFAFTAGYMPLRSVLLSDPTHPIAFKTGSRMARPMAMTIRGKWLYSAESDGSRFHVFDISAPESPTMSAEIRMPGWMDGMYMQESLAYVGCGFTGLFPINVARPASPYIVDTIPVRGGVNEVVIRDTIAYATALDSGVRVINIKNLHAPFEISSLRMPGADGIAGTGSLLYVGYAQGVMIVDISDPMHPLEAGHYDFPSGCGRVVIDSDLVYCLRGGDGFLVLERIPTGSRETNPSRPARDTTVFPSIVRSMVAIRINKTKGGVIKAQVFDTQGRMALRKMLVPSAGSSSITFDLSRLSVGVYFIQLETDRQVTTRRIVKIAQ